MLDEPLALLAEAFGQEPEAPPVGDSVPVANSGQETVPAATAAALDLGGAETTARVAWHA